MRPKVSQCYALDAEVTQLKESMKNRGGGGGGIDSAGMMEASLSWSWQSPFYSVDTSGLHFMENASTQTDSSVASHGGSQTVAAWQQVVIEM